MFTALRRVLDVSSSAIKTGKPPETNDAMIGPRGSKALTFLRFRSMFGVIVTREAI
jgi:hypothetical protein